MIEYTVILVALTTTLYSVTQGLSTSEVVGVNKDQDGTLMNALHQSYTSQNLAIRISELPEYSDLSEMKKYYDQLEKFPTLANQLQSADTKMNNIKQQLDTYNNYVGELSKYKNVKDSFGSLMEDAANELRSGVLP